MDTNELQAEIKGLTHERDVARKACENITYQRDDLRADRSALLAALEGVLSSLYQEGGGHNWRTCSEQMCQNARAAIRQAKGGTV